jgi:PAS domain S-box-containing protein
MCSVSRFRHVNESPRVKRVSKPGSLPPALPSTDVVRSGAEEELRKRDAAGTPVRVVGVAQDITERTRLEHELKISEAYLAEGQRLSHTGSLAWNVVSGEAFWSLETFRIVGLDPDKTKPSLQLFLQLLHPADRPHVEEDIDRAVREKTDLESHYRFLRPDGSIAHVHSLGHPIFDESGEIVEFIGVVMDVTERRLAAECLDRSLKESRALSARLQTIRDEEAERIAREVHDEVGQSLTALAMDVAWLQKKLSKRGPKAQLAMKLETMSRLVESTIESVQRIASDLRPGVLDELGLEPAAEWAIRRFEERTGVTCELETSMNGRVIDSPRATAAFRILQEALSNVGRHARATRVEVLLSARSGKLHLEVRDNGVGIDAARIADSFSLGLLGMRERARSLGGAVLIDRAPEGGTTISAQIPL